MLDQAELRFLFDQLEPRLAASLLKSSRDTFNYDQRAASAASVDSAQFATEHFGKAARYESDEALLRAVVPTARPAGYFWSLVLRLAGRYRILAACRATASLGFD